ncbi:MAG TPA: hypothetical protein VGC41_27110 [Kofleriaceae bacterium]
MSAPRHACALLELAGTRESERLPIGERDRKLLQLRAATFGPSLDLLVTCPACREQLELSIEIARLCEASAELGEHQLVLDDGAELTFRLLDSVDQVIASHSADPASTLVERAIVSAPRSLTEDETARLGERLSELDPVSDLLLDATCPACAHDWQAELDPAAFVAAEIRAAAERLLREVATLARAFGWTEPTVLALSKARRRAYLEMADAMLGGVGTS